ncbi:DUF2490 domain-containing protein [Danxiaibacter flavus]|uniref:DUF2490 domain-containing protein n=1 Tax=Danxiaibacter flavus TaxID=3049108 RepID=A0ABV3ZB09_9BACT|nr:DUF2490 domain-containing protein [Chitinophagaceae bacterium DXS]
MHFRLIYLVLLGISFLPCVKLYAQSQNNFSGWLALFSSYKLNNKLSVHFDGQLRSADKIKEAQSFLIRPGINYMVARNQIATVGYAYVGHFRRINGVSGWANEHRIWEQYIFNQSFPVAERAVSLQHRLRLEQRFISRSEVVNEQLKTKDYVFAQRFRYFARSIFPLGQTSKFTKGMFISLQDEVFFNVTNASAVNNKFFDQNRAYGSIGYRLSPKCDIETGYMYQFVAGRNSNINNHILQIAGYLRL